MTTTRPRIRTATALVTAATTLVLGFGPDLASARPHDRKPPSLLIAGTGTWKERVPNDDPVVIGQADLEVRGHRVRQVPVAATIDPDDNTLPEPGTCEGASGGISVHGTRRSDMWLFGGGEVCGHEVQAPESIVRYTFTGTFLVEEGPRPLLGVDGFYELRLGADGTASVFAIDS